MPNEISYGSPFIGECPNSMDVMVVENTELARGFRLTANGALVNDANVDMDKGIIRIPDRYNGQSVTIEYNASAPHAKEDVLFQDWINFIGKVPPVRSKKKKSTIHKPCRCGSGLNFNHCCNRNGAR